MLLNATTKNVSEWKAITNVIGEMVEDAMFICNFDGITFRGMDTSHVALLDVTFPSTSFEEYEAQTSFFGLRISDLKTILNAAGNSDTISMKIEDSSKMNITITGSLNMNYNLKLIEKTETNTPIPKLDFKSKISISSSTLNRIISNLNSISEFVTIHCNPEQIEFSGKGDIGDGKINLSKNDAEIENLESYEDSSSMYSLEYMYQVIKNIGKETRKIDFEYAQDNPIHLKFEMPSATKVEYYLAPKVSD